MVPPSSLQYAVIRNQTGHVKQSYLALDLRLPLCHRQTSRPALRHVSEVRRRSGSVQVRVRMGQPLRAPPVAAGEVKHSFVQQAADGP